MTALFIAVFAFSAGLTTLVVGLAIVASYFVFNGPIEQPELFLPAAALLVTYLVVVNTNFNLDTVLASFRAGRDLFWIRLHEQVAFMAFAVTWGLIDKSVWGLVVATAGASTTAFLHRVGVIRGFMRFRVSRSELRSGFHTLPDIIRFGLKVVPGSLAGGVSSESGIWVLGLLGSVPAVGAYSRAWFLGRRFLDLSYRVNEMLFPTLIERRARGDHHGFDRALIDSIRYVAIVMLLPAAAVGGAAPQVMGIFGPGFTRAADALAIFMVMPILAATSNFLRHTLFAIDQPVRSSVSGIIAMVVTLATTVVLVHEIGITGAAIGNVLGIGVDATYMFFVARPELAGPVTRLWPWREIAALLLAYVIGFAVARWVGASLPLVLGAGLGVVAGAACYCGGFVLLGGVNPRDGARVRELRARWRERRAAPQPA